MPPGTSGEAIAGWLGAQRRRWAAWLLPWRCLLCGDAGEPGLDLCAGCRGELALNLRCCQRCALPLATSAVLCGRCQRRPPPWDAAWAPYRYAWPLNLLESRYKFAADLAAGRTLAALWCRQAAPAALPQVIVPVPLHRHRLRQRGYNQALELARPLAHALGVPLQTPLLRRVRATVAQTELDAAGRRRNLRGAFEVVGRPPPHVALLDDVMTTGATMAEASRALRRAGVARIEVWALARAPAPR